MRFLIISDTHANWRALEAVLKDVEGKYDQVVCCGDLVGYNPQPVEVVEWTRANCAAVVRGNHDKAVCGLESLEWFNDTAAEAARWTAKRLTPDQIDYLRGLSEGPLKLEHFHLWHGSPRDEDEYVTSAREAMPAFHSLELPLAFFGHTHLQGVFFSTRRNVGSKAAVAPEEKERVLELEPDMLYLVNPGSVGQPRDGDPRAAYALYDSDERMVYLRRIPYDIAGTAADIRRGGLPDVLAERLFHGF